MPIGLPRLIGGLVARMTGNAFDGSCECAGACLPLEDCAPDASSEVFERTASLKSSTCFDETPLSFCGRTFASLDVPAAPTVIFFCLSRSPGSSGSRRRTRLRNSRACFMPTLRAEVLLCRRSKTDCVIQITDGLSLGAGYFEPRAYGVRHRARTLATPSVRGPRGARDFHHILSLGDRTPTQVGRRTQQLRKQA